MPWLCREWKTLHIHIFRGGENDIRQTTHTILNITCEQSYEKPSKKSKCSMSRQQSTMISSSSNISMLLEIILWVGVDNIVP